MKRLLLLVMLAGLTVGEIVAQDTERFADTVKRIEDTITEASEAGAPIQIHGEQLERIERDLHLIALTVIIWGVISVGIAIKKKPAK